MLDDVVDAEVLVAEAVIVAGVEVVGCRMLVGRPVVEPTAAVVLGSTKLLIWLPNPPSRSGEDEVGESVDEAVTEPAVTGVGLAAVTGSVMVFV